MIRLVATRWFVAADESSFWFNFKYLKSGREAIDRDRLVRDEIAVASKVTGKLLRQRLQELSSLAAASSIDTLL